MGYRILPEAEAELDAIWLYIARESSPADAADRLIDTLTGRFSLHGLHPRVGRRRDHDLRSIMRSFAVGGYVIIYRIEEQDALILHVMRGSRDIEGMIGE